MKQPRAAVPMAWAWSVVILGLCWLPKSGLPVKETGPAFLHIPHLDKIIHAGVFAVFGILWARALPDRRWVARIIVGGILLAIVSELGQAMPFVNRDPGLEDVLADLLGLIPSFFLARYVFLSIRRPI